MFNGVEVEVSMHGRQGCLVACVRTEPSTENGVWRRLTQPDVAPEYRTHRTHRTQSPHYKTQDATRLYLMQDDFLLMSGSLEVPLVRRTPANRGRIIRGRAYSPPTFLSSSVGYSFPLAPPSWYSIWCQILESGS